MSKLAAQDKFLDLSDYGRPLATLFAQKIKNPIHTHSCHTSFGVSGNSYLLYLTKPVLLSWFSSKSIIDGADGELARIKNTSYTGRYLDSVFDIILNFLF
jgi:phosphatidylglycerophosphate synthase